MKPGAPQNALSGTGLPEGSFPLEYFRRALARGRLSHAYLLIGPEGSGRKRFAREAAKAIFCSRGRPCGECPSCASVDHGNHPDVHVYSTGEGKSSIEIADARDIEERVHLRRSGFMVVIIEDCDRMTIPAANALLKTLEDPTGEALFFLIVRTAGALLPTIISRCHRISFPDSGEGRAPGGAPAERGSPGSPQSPSLDDPARSGFFSAWEVREWLQGLCPGSGSHREAVRELLDLLLARERSAWLPRSPLEPGQDEVLSRLEEILDLRSDLERNVNPDLVLEGALATLFKFP